MGNTLAILAALVAAVTIFEWGRRMVAVRIPADRRAFKLAMAVAVALGVAAMVAGTDGSATRGARFAVILGGIFLGLNAISAQDRKTPAVRVGGPVLDFTAPDAEGNPWRLSSMAGDPFLLKFFRGHW
jgi:cytochrome oxidase Cu insertion factor (SCO1/SenC/PrrC family)